MTSQTYSQQPAKPWLAPLANGPINAAVELPGSKSLNNRELVLSALASGPSLLTGTLDSRDSSLMIDALRSLGTQIEVNTDGSILVTPAPFDRSADIECGLAGTVMRFLPPVSVLANGVVNFDGDEGARRRPMHTTIDSLRALGVSVTDGKDGSHSGSLPFTVHGTGAVAGGEITIDASASSQFVSGLLLAAARYKNGLTLRHEGEQLPSMPHIEMTLDCLAKRGVKVTSPSSTVWRVEPGPINGGTFAIEPDLSNAGPFLAAAMIAGGSVLIHRWPETTTQVGDEFDGILQQMGATIVRENGGLRITGTGQIHGIDIDLSIGGELTPVIAALAALANSPSVIRGVAHLRGHETDRLAALAAEINRIGGIARETADGLEIDPSTNLHGAVWHTYEDHRMATAGAIIGLRVPGIEIEDITTTSKTMPEFSKMWQHMLGATA
jgi:3-phosphoshikimate 1-carboxyvinyltransferase